MRTRMIIKTIVGCVFLVSPALAGPAVRSDIPDSAKWVAHFDVEALTASQIGRGAMELIRNNASAITQQKVQKAEKIWKIFADVKSLTFYGCTLDKTDAVVVAKLDYDKADIMKLLGIHSYGDHDIYATGPKGQECQGMEKTHFVCLYDKNTIVASRKQERLKEALDLLDGRGRPLRTNQPLSKLIGPAQGSIVVFAAQDVNKMVENLQKKQGREERRSHAAALKKCQSLRLEMGEANAKMFTNLNGVMTSNEDATNVQQAAQGLLALAMLHSQDDERVTKILQDVKIDLEGSNVALQMQFSVEDILAKMQDKLEQRAAAKNEAGE